MKKLLLLLLTLPVFLAAQEKTVVTFERYFPKPDKVNAFEKNLAAHVQKFHKGDVGWRVFSIESGPDAGGYLVTEGPTSWDGVDKRGDLGKMHMDDWQMNVQPLLLDKATTDYFVYRLDLSTADLSGTTDKVTIGHNYYKPGYYNEATELLKGLKNNWVQNGQSVAVFESSSSGEPQLMTFTMYKQGLKERETAFRPALPVTFAKANGGEPAWNKFVEGVKMSINRQW
ncbi:MAG TPA: hypothetical protein VFL47_08570, partial [Flavisolibacter sp.]|nr:hypothetical protein [Flavisolibacter sp.]